MKRRMTRERLREKVRSLYPQVEAQQMLELADDIWKLADIELQLREVHDERNKRTIPYSLARRSKTIFRLGLEAKAQEKEKLAIDLPFSAWEDNGPWTPDLKKLRKALLEAASRSHLTRLDKGGATRDIRLELEESSLDILMNAIRTIYCEVEQNL